MKPEIPISHTSNRFFPLFAALVAVILILGVGLTLYNINKQKGLTNTPKNTQTTKTASLPVPQTEQIEGRAVSLKDNLLTLKKKDGQEVQIKVASNAAILKQKEFGPGAMGTVPTEIKPGDQVSVTVTKNPDGDVAYSIIVPK